MPSAEAVTAGAMAAVVGTPAKALPTPVVSETAARTDATVAAFSVCASFIRCIGFSFASRETDRLKRLRPLSPHDLKYEARPDYFKPSLNSGLIRGSDIVHKSLSQRDELSKAEV